MKVWLARDKFGSLYAYSAEPERRNCTFQANDIINQWVCFKMPDRLFPEVTWENSPKVAYINIE